MTLKTHTLSEGSGHPVVQGPGTRGRRRGWAVGAGHPGSKAQAPGWRWRQALEGPGTRGRLEWPRRAAKVAGHPRGESPRTRGELGRLRQEAGHPGWSEATARGCG